MKRLTTLFLSLVFLGANLIAQPVNCDFGVNKKIKLEKGDSYEKMIGADKTGFYVLRLDFEGKIWLEFFNSDNLVKESSNELILPSVGGVQAEYLKMFYLDGNLILFTTVTNESIKQKTLYAQHVNKAGKIIGETKPIGRLTNQNIVVDFNIELTKDGKNIFVQYYRPFQKYNEEPYFLKIYSPELEEVMNKTIKLPLVDREFDIIQYIVMNSGDILMLAKIKPADDGRRRGSGPEVFEYSVLYFDTELSLITDYPINIEKYIPQNAIMGVNEKDNFIDVMGFIAKKNKVEYSGVFHERLNMISKEWEPVDPKTTYYTIPRNEERNFRAMHLMENRDEMYNYQLRDLVYLSTGEPVMFAEHYNEWMDSIVDPRTKEVMYNYYYKYNDILAAKIDRNNKFEWMTRIPKSQSSYNDFGDYSSFALSVVGEKVKLFYNGNHKNLKMLANDMYNSQDLKEAKSPGRSGRALTVTVFSDGKVFGSYMFDNKHSKQIIKREMITEHNGRYFMYTKRGSAVQFVRFFVE
jgi:hypothetical protein